MAWTSVIRLAAGLTAALGALALAPGVAAQTLTGEQFQGTATITSAECSDSGQSTFSYFASGTAIGRYPGLFTETGTVTMEGRGPSRPTAFTASFTITPDPADPAPTFQEVTGTKTIGDPTGGEAFCALDTSGPEDNVFVLNVTHSYHADITNAAGETCTDDGTGTMQLRSFRELGLEFGTLSEDFLSDGQSSCAGGGEDDQGEDNDDQGEDEDNQGDGGLP